MVRFRLRLSDESAAKSLADFFERRGCPVTPAKRNLLVVGISYENELEAGRHELELLLRVWGADHPGVRVFEASERSGTDEIHRRL
jgi:hypothetical protein